MAEVNKVEVGFGANVRDFNRGVDKMQRKLAEFEAQADKNTANVNKRFDLMSGSLGKVEKQLGGFGDNVDLSHLQDKLQVAQKEFTETGKVSEDSFRKLETAINSVDFSQLDAKATKSIQHINNDFGKLSKQLDKAKNFRFAEEMPEDIRRVAFEFSKLQSDMNKNELSFRQLRQSMSTKDFENYKKAIISVRGSMSAFEKEIRDTGTVSSKTFYDLNNSVKQVDFGMLPKQSFKAFNSVRTHVKSVETEFNRMNTSMTRTQNRFNIFRNVLNKGASGLKSRFNDTINTFNRWGTVFRNMQEVGEHFFGGVMLPMLSNLIPIAGTATTGIMGIANGLMSVGGAAVGLGGAYGIALGAIQAFSAQGSYALQMLEDGTLRSTAEVRRYQQSLDALKGSWEGLIAQNQSAIFNTMTNGINAARFALGALNPFLTKTASLIENASGKMLNWLRTSNNAKGVFNMLNTTGVSSFRNVLNAGGMFGDGLAAIIRQLGPLISYMSNGLENMARRFQTFANSKQAQQGIADFTNYTKANLPIVGSIFGNTFRGIFNLFRAFSGQTTWAMKGLDGLTAKFENWSANLSKTQGFKDFIKFTRDNAPVAGKFIGNLFDVIVELVKAIAPMSAVILRYTTAFLGWTAAMMKAHPWIGKVVAALLLFGGALKTMTFIGIFINNILGLRRALVLLVGTQKLASFAGGIFTASAVKQNGIIKTLKLAYSGLVTKIKSFDLAQKMAALRTKMLNAYIVIQNGIMRASRSVWAALRTRIAAVILATKIHMATLKASIVTSRAWTLASKAAALATRGLGLAIRFMTGPVGIVITIIGALVAVVIHLWKTNATFRNGVISIWNSIKSAALSIFGSIGSFLKGVWNGIAQAWTASWNFIKAAASIAWNGIKFAIQHPIQALKLALQTIWNAIKLSATLSWNAIKAAVMFIIRSWLTGVKFYFGLWKTVITAVWNAIKFISVTAWNGIKNAVMFIIRGWLASVRLSLNMWKSVFTAVWNAIKFVSITVWTSIKNSVLFIVRSLINGIKFVVTGLRTFFVKTWTFIKTISITLWNAIKNAVVNSARRLVNGVKLVVGTLKTWFVNTWNYIKTRTVAIVNLIRTLVVLAFRKLSNSVRLVISTLKNWLIKAWTFIKNRIVAIARLIWTGVKLAFTKLSASIRSITTALRNWLIKAWNYIKTKVVNAVRFMVKSVISFFSKLSKNIRSITTALRNWIVKAWNYIKNKIVSIVKGIWKTVTSYFKKLSNTIKSINNSIKKFLYRVWTQIKDKVVSLAKSMWNKVKGTFTAMKKGVSNLTSKARDSVVNHWKKMKSSVTGLASGMWKKVKGTFSNMSNGIRNFSGKIKGHINSMVSGIKKGLNKLIEGVNWVGGKLGIDKKIPKLSTGTGNARRYVSNGKINQDTMAVVGDKGRGNGKGGFRNETITYPNGKSVITPATDTLAYLPKGSTVESGAQTQAAFSEGTLPKFSTGTNSGQDVRKRMLKDAKKHKKHKHPTFDAGEMMSKVGAGGAGGAGGIGSAVNQAWNFVKDKTSNAGKSAKRTTKSLTKGAKKMLNTASDAVGAAGSWAKEKAGDLMDFIGKPGKLVDKILKEFGVDFGAINGEIPKMLWDAMWKRLKEGVKSLFGGWLDDVSGGDGDGRFIKYLDNITTRYSPNGPPPGYPFNWAHPGIDLPYIYEKVLTPMGGKAETKLTSSGFGRHVIVRAKPYDAYFGHLSKWLVKNGQRVKPGDPIGISGNTGSSSGPHLHFEMNKHGFGSMTGHSIDPVKWLKSHNGSGGAPKAGIKWAPQIKQALRMNGLPTTSAYVNAWARQIDSESSGNPRAVQGGYVDANTGGNEAKGLVQVARGTFQSMKFPGHGNVFNPLDNLLAGIHWAKVRYGRNMLGVIGHGHGYENGGIVNSKQLAWLAEGGFSESVISHDPANRVKSKAIYDRTGEMLGFNDDTEILLRVEQLLAEHNYHARNIDENTRRQAEKSSVIQMNGRAVAKEIAEDTNTEIKRIEARKNKFRKGGGR
ncbi:peptidoglycan DD-metalloendopeptidase family protein [Staphylococcus haemolyticus]|uniref:peptidoglycan DD-metalloendopeptidase family protein n=1 Tax=Staphylococcus haemolyticus TaxID=1283 RepID=UPI002DB8CB9F|nr:peptidoglycan DD-metalloendopeptidase family protein [Staphylococcus haemolyticus]MEB5827111.1 peptidoglycan DD-metalloendopeptidase family protein [Staphylococcus haemolyticus]